MQHSSKMMRQHHSSTHILQQHISFSRIKNNRPTSNHNPRSLSTSPPFNTLLARSTPTASIHSNPPPPPLPSAATEQEIYPGVYEGFWTWQGHAIRYTRSGDKGPPVLCVHGFGGNADHWRKNLPQLGQQHRAYAIDLLGYGKSSKPDPRDQPVNSIYNFENWSTQLRSFIQDIIGEPTLVTTNSVGGIAGLQAAIDDPLLVQGVQLMNVSLRMLHVSKQAPWQRPLVSALQAALRRSFLGPAFFSSIATKEGVRSVLQQCYHNPAAVDDELVDVILTPGLDPGAVHVFLDFISYSGGALPETLLQQCTVPVSIVWGEKDPWEKIEWGRELAKMPSVEEFISLPNVGHCPQDEAPDVVNPIIIDWVERQIQKRGVEV